MEITFKSSKIIKLLSLVAIILIGIHITILGVQFYTGIPVKLELLRMFNLDVEANLPTLFSYSILFFSAFLFYLLSKVSQDKKSKDRPFWLGLSFIFTFLAFDESIKIHEAVGALTEKFVEANGYVNYPWVIPYAVLVLVVGLFYIRFFWRMERKVFWSFVGAAVMYVSGAIGCELLGANEVSLHGDHTVLYSIYSTTEESLEIFGVIFLIYILLDLLADISFKLNFRT